MRARTLQRRLHLAGELLGVGLGDVLLRLLRVLGEGLRVLEVRRELLDARVVLGRRRRAGLVRALRVAGFLGLRRAFGVAGRVGLARFVGAFGLVRALRFVDV